MELTYWHHQARQNVHSLQAANQGKQKKNARKTVCRNQRQKVDEAVRFCLVQWHLYAIGIAHKGSFHRLTMANLLRSAQQTRNSHKKARHAQGKIQMAEELPLQRVREAGSTDSRLHHAGLHDVACSVSHSRNITNQMQCRSATKDIASYSGRRNMQHCSK